STSTSQEGNKYRAVYTNACASATTNILTLHVGAPINLGLNPSNQTGCNGQTTVTFTSNANGGNGTVYMSWQYSHDGITWIDIPGTITTSLIGNFSTSYSFIPPSVYQNGDLFRARYINGGCQASFSTPATLTINPIPTINPNPDQTVCNGGATTA